MTTGSVRVVRELGSIMSTSCQEKEQQCVVHWFRGWSPFQKQQFLSLLVDKALPLSVHSLFGAMDSMTVVDKPPSIFQCQLKLFTQWFDGWTDGDRNQFVRHLQVLDPQFVSEFNLRVDQAAGKIS